MPATDPTAFRGPQPVSTTPEAEAPARLCAVPDHGPERRRSGRRARARDRLMDRATQAPTHSAALEGVDNVENLLLFVDDDLRETALAIHHIEAFLVRTLGLLESDDLRREDVVSVAGDTTVLDHVDMLNETLESLRRRLARLASRMR
ncbi:MAG: hypothetical protein H6712_24610 [Myxococcales bacterium]|nr:hypothetical protein [Myxococcales bacterium]MCB9717062.1 hypothetical protein [Myxococcales bacterium]